MTQNLNMTRTLTSRSGNQRVWISLLAFAATCFFFFPPLTQASDQRRIEIEIENFQFVSGEMDLRPGDVVVWINRDIAPHTATALDGSWDSGLLKTGDSWEMLIGEDISLAYFCKFHPLMTSTLTLKLESRDLEK